MCGALVDLAGATAAVVAGLDKLSKVNDLLNPKLPEFKVPERPGAPERSADRVKSRSSLNPKGQDKLSSGLDFFTLELSNLFGK